MPSKILQGIKEIFIPDTDAIKTNFEATIENISNIVGLNFDSVKDSFESLTEQPVADVRDDYYLNGVGTLKLTFLDSKYLSDGVAFFRPFIRGFLVLMLLFFNHRQFLSFIGQEAVDIGNNIATELKGSGKK